jgi:Ca2+-binding RTX toxin-like protein
LADLDAREQLALELTNRARMDPLGEAARYGIDLNAGLPAGTISATAKQVLAPSSILESSAQLHANYLVANNLFTHTGSGGSTSNQRMATAGYATAGTFFSGENIAFSGSTGAYNANAEVFGQHQQWMLSSGHRTNMLLDIYEELGVGHVAFTGTSYRGATNGMVMVQNFGALTTSAQFITGVSYNDTDSNDFYSIGEGMSSRLVQVLQSGSVLASSTTAAAGGYGVKLTASGLVEVVFSGGGLTSSQGVNVTLGASNIKVDMVDNNTIETNFSATLTQTAQNLRLIGIENINGTGNGLNNTMWGNKGNNVFAGGAGNDVVNGGAGTDTVVFTANMNQYVVTYNAATLTHTFYGNDGFIDTATGVESFQFADGTRTAAQLVIAPAAPVRTASITAAIATANEGNSGTTAFTFNVTLNAAAYSTQTVNWTATGSGVNAANAADFSGALSGTVTFAAGEIVKTVTVNVAGDTTAEATETFSVTLSTPSAGIALGTASSVGTITNDDASGPNIINGDAGGATIHDTLVGTAGVDHVNGLNGDDTLIGNGGADVLNGGNGTDSAYYYSSAAGVTVNLAAGTGSGGDAAGDSYVSIESIIGSNGSADVLTGNAAANYIAGFGGNDTIDGGAGADTLVGGDGTDTVYYYSSTAGVTVNLAAGTGAGGDAAGDTLNAVEQVIGSNTADDILIGDGVMNYLAGMGGNDTIDGGGVASPNGIGQGDSLDGGEGTDTLSYASSAQRVIVLMDYNSPTSGIAWNGTSGDVMINFENLTGSAHNDVLLGSDSANVINGGAGQDSLYGELGADTFHFDNLSSDAIHDFQDGVDKLSFNLATADSFNDFAIFGNGGTDYIAVQLITDGSLIILKGAGNSAVTLDASDFLFV